MLTRQTYCLLLAVLTLFLVISPAYSAQSTITEAEGYSCMGTDKSRKQTEQDALDNAKRKAAENTLTYIMSESKTKNYQLEKDIVEACSRAKVKVLKTKGHWSKNEHSGECFNVWIKAEVIPDDKGMEGLSNEKQITADPVTYKGNSNSKVFHHPRCRYYDCKNCIATFASKDDAVRAGYRSCKMCSP